MKLVGSKFQQYIQLFLTQHWSVLNRRTLGQAAELSTALSWHSERHSSQFGCRHARRVSHFPGLIDRIVISQRRTLYESLIALTVQQRIVKDNTDTMWKSKEK